MAHSSSSTCGGGGEAGRDASAQNKATRMKRFAGLWARKAVDLANNEVKVYAEEFRPSPDGDRAHNGS